MRSRVNVVVVDDDADTRRSIATLLENQGVRVLGEAANGLQAVQLCQQLLPDIVVLDVSMPLLAGFEAAPQIAALSPASKIIFLSVHTLKEYVDEALQVGGVGYVFKERAAQDLPAAIAAALDGKTFISGATAE